MILTTQPRWRGQTLTEALAKRVPPSALERAFRVTADWANDPPDAYVGGEAVMRTDARLAHASRATPRALDLRRARSVRSTLAG